MSEILYPTKFVIEPLYLPAKKGFFRNIALLITSENFLSLQLFIIFRF